MSTPPVQVCAFPPYNSVLCSLYSKVYCFGGDVTNPLVFHADKRKKEDQWGVSSSSSSTICSDCACTWSVEYRLTVRVNPNHVTPLMNVLALCAYPERLRQENRYDAEEGGEEEEPGGAGGGASPTYILSDEVKREAVRFRVRGMCRDAWRKQVCDFDIDLVCRNMTSMYLLQDAKLLTGESRDCHAGQYVSITHTQDVYDKGDKLGFLSRRLMDRKFSLLRSYYGADDRTVSRMQRAYHLVCTGWKMDVSAGNVPWLICHWWLISHVHPCVRALMGVPMQVFLHPNVKECAICHEAFQPWEIVIWLQCGHVFHCRCDADKKKKDQLVFQGGRYSPSLSAGRVQERRTEGRHPGTHIGYEGGGGGGGGVLRWFRQGGCTCPLCRASVVG